MALLVILVLLWGIALLPGAVRARRDDVSSSVGGFGRTMAVLRTRALPRRIEVSDHAIHTVVVPSLRGTPDGRRRMLARRRRLLGVLLGATAAAVTVGVLLGGMAWIATGVTATALVGYLALLRAYERRRQQFADVVRPLDLPRETVVQSDSAEWTMLPARELSVVGPRGRGDAAGSPVAVGAVGAAVAGVAVARGPATPAAPDGTVVAEALVAADG